MLKLRVIAPRSRDAPLRNRAHIFYIGKRIGVSLNSGIIHGLFGKTNGNDFGEIKSIKETADYIQKKAGRYNHVSWNNLTYGNSSLTTHA